MLKKTNKESDAESLEAALTSAVRLLSTLSEVSLMVSDGDLQIHRRQGCLPEILPEETIDTSCPGHICFGR